MNKKMTQFIVDFVKGHYPSKLKKRREETRKQQEHNRKMAVYCRVRRVRIIYVFICYTDILKQNMYKL